MNQFRLRMALVLVAVCSVTMALAQNIYGTYAGYSSYYRSDVQMRFNGSRVDVRIVPRNGSVKYQRGSYNESSGTLTIEGVVFMVRKSGDVVKVRESKNSLNTYDLYPKNLGNVDWGSSGGSGGSGWGNVGGGDNDNIDAQRPPSWAVGSFDGYNRLYDSDIQLTITNNGQVTARIRSNNGDRTTQYGVYRNGRISLSNVWFDVSRSDNNGLRTYQVNDRNNWMEYRRTGSGNWGGSGGSGGIGENRPPDAPPSWARGSFEGYNKLYEATIDLTIDSRGYLKARISYRDGRRVNQDGWYRGGKMVVGGTTFTCTRLGDGFRLVQVGDADNAVSYRRIR